MVTKNGSPGYWDAAAEAFDDEPDHAMRSPEVRAAWAARLRAWLPQRASEVLDLGCGTGSLALLAAEQGHRVTAVDFSPRMAERAAAKLAGAGAHVLLGDAARPPVAAGRFDVVLVRHVLWTLPDPRAALRHWVRLLRPAGRLVLVEGRWGEGERVGLTAETLAEMVAPLAARTRIEQLGHDAALWGRPVTDERYAAVVHPAPDPAAALAAGAVPTRHAEIVDVHLLLRRGDEVLLARRGNTGYADGLLHAPSGHVEEGEDVRDALIREAYEEIGVAVDPADIRVALVMQHRAPDGDARIGWFFEVRRWDGEPVNNEPDKCSQLGWFPLDALPDDMVAYCRAGIEAYRRGEQFVLHWHRSGDRIAFSPTGPGRAVALPPAATHRRTQWWAPSAETPPGDRT